ncbi:MAG: transposase [Candidatus Synoicihabitans palmerolidicus]|nr:transposase [Candidatus Synoicihabitans palmerolidicus]
MPGAGPIFAPRLYTAFVRHMPNCEGPEAFAAAVGVAPVTDQSGKVRRIYRRLRCDSFTRQSFVDKARQRGEGRRPGVKRRVAGAGARIAGGECHNGLRSRGNTPCGPRRFTVSAKPMAMGSMPSCAPSSTNGSASSGDVGRTMSRTMNLRFMRPDTEIRANRVLQKGALF